jgi:metal-responsive CopG/Arc/MetJ family transcriptional regulator
MARNVAMVQISIRLPKHVLREADAIVRALKDRGEDVGRVDRASVLRRAVARGVCDMMIEQKRRPA